MVLTETKIKGKGQELLGEYVHMWSGVDRDQRARAGVSFLIKKTHRRRITHYEEISERLMRVDFDFLGRKIVIIGVYAPGNNETPVAKDAFDEDFRATLEKIRGNEEIVLMGDFNARVGRAVGSRVVGRHGEDVITNNGRRLLDVCESFDLKIQNTFFVHKRIHQATWDKPGFQSSVLDYVITRQESTIKVEDVRVFRGWECGSDHYMLRAKIYFHWTRGKSQREGGRPAEADIIPHYKLDLLSDPSIRDLYRRRLEARVDLNVGVGASEKYAHLKECIHAAATEALGLEEKRPKPDWWSQEVAQLVGQKKAAYQRYLSSGANEEWVAYRRLNKKVKDLVAREKNASWDRCCQRIDSTLGYNRVRESWGVLKKLRAPRKGNVLSQISDRAWKAHFEDLLRESRPQFKEERRRTRTTPGRVTVTMEELTQALKSSKNGKAPGPGGIPMELLKAGGDRMMSILLEIINLVLGGDRIPDDLRTGFISPIFKKGDRKVCRNYRGICVQSSVSRIIGRLLRDKLEDAFRTPEEQAGFTAGRSCSDNIFVLRQLIEKSQEMNQELHIAFVDLEQAYDSVPRSRLWAALREAGISEILIDAVRHLYQDDIYRVKLGNRLSEPFTGTKGLKQGCSMAPTLFKIYLYISVKDWYNRCGDVGPFIDGEQLLSLFFADDQAVFARRKVYLEMIMCALWDCYESMGLRINFSKTEYMAVCAEDDGDLHVGSQTCTKVNIFKYLGSYLDSTGSSEADVRRKVEQARKATRMLHPVLWNDTILKENKRRIYLAIVEPILTYAAETWTMSPQLYSEVQAVEMDFWRRCLRVTRMDKIRNEVVRDRMDAPVSVNQRIGQRRLRWCGHVRRMPTERWPHRVLDWHPPGRRRRGRPRSRWIHGVEEEMAGRGLRDGDWLDRDLWSSALT